jgi:hypothetical protein
LPEHVLTLFELPVNIGARASNPFKKGELMDEDQKINEAAKELSRLGASKGGIARAEKLTPEERSDIARRAVEVRWEKTKNKDHLPKATHEGDLKIGSMTIKCAVLDDGTRVLSRATFLKAIGRRGKAKGGREYDEEFKVPVFLSAKNLKPFISDNLVENSKPILFRLKGQRSIGYKAEFLPQVCGVFLDAFEANAISITQKHIVDKCKILIRGLATVGIIALVDEATGYQEVRDRLALQEILDKYLTDEWAKWTKTFPDEYYKELFRLKNIPYPPLSRNKPSFIGHWTNDIIYSRLAAGVLKTLKEKNPRLPSGYRARRHHQYFTRDYGHPELKDLLSNVVFLMRGCADWDDFKYRLDRAQPKYGDTLLIDFKR